MVCRLAIIAVVLGFGWCHAETNVDDARWKERLFKEGPPAWEAWRQFNKHLEGVVRVTEFGTATVVNPTYGPVKPPETTDWLFKFNGDWALQEKGRVIETTEHGSPENPRPAGVAIAISSKYGFSVKRQTDDSPWLIGGVVTRNYKNLRAEFDEGVLEYVEAPWVFLGYPLPTLIDAPGFKLRGCEAAPRDGRELCKISFDYTPTPERPKWIGTMRGAWLLLDPDQHWAIQAWEIPEYVFTTRKGKKISETVSGSNVYGKVSHGFPLLREARHRTTGTEGYTDENAVFTRLAYRDSIPEAEFGLAQYGLPEPYGPLASGKSMRGPISILAGLVAIVVAGLLFYRVRNARASQT